MPHLHSIELSLYVRVGSRYETAKNNGIAHFIEHMFFRGSLHFPTSRALNRRFELIGEGLNASTFREFTCYWTKIHPLYLKEGLYILADVFNYPLFKDIDLEKKIILEEVLEEQDEWGRTIEIDSISRKFVWANHPLGDYIIGRKSNILRFTKKELVAFYQKFYAASNMIMCVTGKVTRAKVLKLAQQYFGDFRRGKKRYPRPYRVKQKKPRAKFFYFESPQFNIQLCFHSIGEHHPQMPALLLVQRILDDGLSSRLQRNICEKKGLAYDLCANVDCYSDAGAFDIDVSVSPAKLFSVIEALLYELNKLRHILVGARELEKVKGRCQRDFEFILDSARQMSIIFGEAKVSDISKSPQDKIEKILKVTPLDIRQVSRKVFRRENLNLIVMGEFKKKDCLRIKKLLRAF